MTVYLGMLEFNYQFDTLHGDSLNSLLLLYNLYQKSPNGYFKYVIYTLSFLPYVVVVLIYDKQLSENIKMKIN